MVKKAIYGGQRSHTDKEKYRYRLYGKQVLKKIFLGKIEI